MPPATANLSRLLDELGDIPCFTDPALVRQKSRDFFWYSPLLNEQLRDRTAQAVLRPRDEADVLRIAAGCARHRVPLTPRGGGTGNYGQAVPLRGGIVLDMTALDSIEWHRASMVRTGPGRKLIDLDAATRPSGWELRMHPSTKRSATIGGFVAGGSGGIGSVTWGGLREPGNVAAARIVTVQDAPRVLELHGSDTAAVNHAYGTTGIITALEMPLAPAWQWTEMIIAFPQFLQAAACGQALALADGIVKKLVTAIAWPIPEAFRPIRTHCPDGRAILITMLADPSVAAFKSLLARSHSTGEITLEQRATDAPGDTPLYEFTWNHTTLQMLKRDRSITYLQTLYPADRLLASVQDLDELFGDEVIGHLEFLRVNGRVTASGLPLIRYSTAQRLADIIAIHRQRGISIADPHVYTLEDGAGHKRVDADQLGFKRHADPHDLLNPGKMRSYSIE